jgi:alanyl-tRNA synthetase
MTSTNDIRSSFLDFFAGEGHAKLESSSLVPRNDPTLMFTNAGMVQFKNVFTGLEARPYSTAVTSQKCVRAGGKHNDLDNVGYTARHHTFFEMLGNFSFGDYFKERAIESAWRLLTKEWGLDKSRLCVTVYHDDDAAFDLWKKIAGLSEDKIIRIATKDNFWSMGDTGPCGPCSEIFYDHGDHIFGGPPGSADQDGDRFTEIWNLVFMQYEQVDADTRNTLPKPSIDTGMGLERIAAVMQGTHDNFETDTFKALIEASAHATHTETHGKFKISHRVIADHLRASSFLIADGVLPSNDGRGYVLRRIMRRAMRHAHLSGAAEPLMHKLVGALVNQMGAAYPELKRAEALIRETLKLEENNFRRTLANGLRLLDDELAKLPDGSELPGDVAFKLYDTFGFPYDLTEDALRAQNRTVDRAGFDTSMAEQKRRAREAWKGSGQKADAAIWFDIVQELGATDFVGYSTERAEGKIIAIVKNGARVESATVGDAVTLLTNQTPFYGESGGQAGDAGEIKSASAHIEIEDTQKPLGLLHSHIGIVKSGTLKVGDDVFLNVNAVRRAQTRANHSATHLLHEALRRVLGEHVSQKGSLVAHDKLRFDISHNKAMTQQELLAVEADVNARIRENSEVTTRLMTPDEAIEAGAMALFGEKYGDEVRVLAMGGAEENSSRDQYSVELCGGTHVTRVGDIGLLKITSEGAVSAGVRRIEALTGEAARLFFQAQEDRLLNVAAHLKTSPMDVPERVAQLMATAKRLEKELADAKKALALGGSGGGAGAATEMIGDIGFISQIIDGLDPKELRGVTEELRKSVGSGIAVVVATLDGKASVAVGVSDDLTTKYSAVDLTKAAVIALGGQGGGGRPTMAQGGGPNAGAADEALAAVKAKI